MITKNLPTKKSSFKKQLLWFVGIYAASIVVYAVVTLAIHFIVILLK